MLKSLTIIVNFFSCSFSVLLSCILKFCYDVYKYLNEPVFIDSPSENKYQGIGLSVSNTLVKLHGGVIEAKNNEDGGAIFTIKLPLVKNDEE